MKTIISFVFLLTFSAHATTLYLDVDVVGGNDDGTSWANAWNTIEEAASEMEYGDTVLIRDGYYGEGGTNGKQWEDNNSFGTFSGDETSILPEETLWKTFRAAPGETGVYFGKIEFGENLPSDKISDVRYIIDGVNIDSATGIANGFTACKAEVLMQGVRGLQLLNCTLAGSGTDAGGVAFFSKSTSGFRGSNITVNNCAISNYEHGFKVFGHHITISNNSIITIGDDFISADIGNDTLIEGNFLDDSVAAPGAHPDSIVLAGTKTNVTIRGNICADNDTQGFFCTGGSTRSYTNVLWENNLVYNIDSVEFTIRNVTNGIIRHNTIIGDRGAVRYTCRFDDSDDSGNTNIDVYHNLFIDDKSGYGGGDWATAMATSDHDYNIYIKGAAGIWEEANANSISPYADLAAALSDLFTNPGSRNYSLKVGADAIDFCQSGWDVYPTDIAGNLRDGSPDAGAYEFFVPGSDTDPPEPDPMTFATNPASSGVASIDMTASTATDPCDVEYYFEETVGNPGASDSGWQDAAAYEDTGLDDNTEYTYRVRARDKSSNQNTTAWSDPRPATTDTDSTRPEPDPSTWSTVPTSDGATTVSMIATTATDDSGVEYYFDNTTVEGHDSGWQDSSTYIDSDLNFETEYTYTIQVRDKATTPNLTTTSEPNSVTTGTVPEFYDIGVTDSLSGEHTTTSVEKRAIPVLCTGDGNIQSITMYHAGGDPCDDMFLAVYDDDSGEPKNLMGVTAQTSISADTGWQKIDLIAEAAITEDQIVWLAWSYESNEDIYWDDKGNVENTVAGRAAADESWTGDMPDPFPFDGASDAVYSIYATYTVESEVETDPPEPDPATWSTVPYARGSVTIGMIATSATDVSGVEYYFACTTCDDSGWQDSPIYTNGGLSPSTKYTYTIQYRDKSINQNAGEASSGASATTLDAGRTLRARYSGGSARARYNFE